MERIQQIWVQIKAFADDAVGEWGLIALVILVGVASFGLGRLSAIIESKPLVMVTQATAAAGAATMPLGGQYVASKTGTVYYYPWCSGAQKIATASQRWFATREAAERAGYRAAKNCKGL
ncbi:MAG TPA: hypothetical protein VJH91_01200 [Candidatus Paceibacterota bacterium]